MQIVLMYHDVFLKEQSESGFIKKTMHQYKICEAVFKKQIAEISDYIQGHPNDKVVLSFDDGGSSFIKRIAPILEHYDIKGLFFISTKYINTDGFLTEEQIIELERRGHIVGSHSYSHPENILDLAKEEQEEEWKRSLNDLERILGHKLNVVSIPNGYVNNETLRIISELGISTVYTSEPTTQVTYVNGVAVVGRYAVFNGMSDNDVLELISSNKRRMMLALRWNLLKVVKALMGSNYNRLKKIIIR